VTDVVGVGRTKRFEITKRLVSKHLKRRCRFAPAVADFHKNDFFRVFPSWESDETLTIKADSMELLKLLRFVLRSNSTKIKPTTWQKNHLPLEENSPWLATFISPLYLDAPLDKKKVKPNLFFSLIKLVIYIVIICAVLYAIGCMFLNVLSYVF
jgi:hypothetical protein